MALSTEQAAEISRRGAAHSLGSGARRLVSAPISRAEVPVVATLIDAQGKTFRPLTGQIDRLLVREWDCVILDYKSKPPARPCRRHRLHPPICGSWAAYRAADSGDLPREINQL